MSRAEPSPADEDTRSLAAAAVLALPDVLPLFVLADRLDECGRTASAGRIRTAAKAVERLYRELARLGAGKAPV